MYKNLLSLNIKNARIAVIEKLELLSKNDIKKIEKRKDNRKED